MASVKVLEARIPKNLYAEIEERVRLGLFETKSEVVKRALEKSFAEDARKFLRDFIKNAKISKRALLAETNLNFSP